MYCLILGLLLLGATPAFAADLALKRVMLSSAGVGYFEFEAEVDGLPPLPIQSQIPTLDALLAEG